MDHSFTFVQFNLPRLRKHILWLGNHKILSQPSSHHNDRYIISAFCFDCPFSSSHSWKSYWFPIVKEPHWWKFSESNCLVDLNYHLFSLCRNSCGFLIVNSFPRIWIKFRNVVFWKQNSILISQMIAQSLSIAVSRRKLRRGEGGSALSFYQWLSILLPWKFPPTHFSVERSTLGSMWKIPPPSFFGWFLEFFLNFAPKLNFFFVADFVFSFKKGQIFQIKFLKVHPKVAFPEKTIFWPLFKGFYEYCCFGWSTNEFVLDSDSLHVFPLIFSTHFRPCLIVFTPRFLDNFGLVWGGKLTVIDSSSGFVCFLPIPWEIPFNNPMFPALKIYSWGVGSTSPLQAGAQVPEPVLISRPRCANLRPQN